MSELTPPTNPAIPPIGGREGPPAGAAAGAVGAVEAAVSPEGAAAGGSASTVEPQSAAAPLAAAVAAPAVAAPAIVAPGVAAPGVEPAALGAVPASEAPPPPPPASGEAAFFGVPSDAGSPPAAASLPSAPADEGRPAPPWLWPAVALGAVAVLAVASLSVALKAQQRVQQIEQELVLRQRASQDQAAQARALAQPASDAVRDAAAKIALLEARVGEVTVQRSQLEELIGSMSRTRDENVVSDIESAVRIAMQQSAVSGSVEPLVIALRQSDERLARHAQRRLDGLRRAIARDLERVRAVGTVDIATLAAKLDEALRMVDELPLLASTSAEERRVAAGERRGVARGAESEAPAASTWWPDWLASERWRAALASVWSELRALVRVTQIDRPEAMLVAPEQAFFLRENVKLRLLNARLALLARQFETARADLHSSEAWLQRYFDPASRRTKLALELTRQVAAQAHQGSVARPDETLAALAAAAAVR